ncbi:MAG: class I SAM-dependent methyltransferase [Psychroserpens sp.]|uniref:class I SAM-dependent methyltransferase n=1 Tax=Psychroserpens sp. TaxID=2020870 RepID=UPI0030013181
MKRIELINEILKSTNFENYLEIGCYKGKTFFPVIAKRKIAVDPFFHFMFLKEALVWVFKMPKNLKNKYFKEESDLFFLKRKTLLTRIDALDVVFIDGLHTFRASLNDVFNSLQYLNPKGIIIMHDCYPENEAAALPTGDYPTKEELEGVEGWTGAWCGDVWKSILYLRQNYSETLDVCVVNSDCGLGIIRFKENGISDNYVINENNFSDIDNLTYKDLRNNLEPYLNLKPAEYANTIIDEMALNY